MKTSASVRAFLKLPIAAAIGMAALASQQASAHGYIESPASRSFMCSANGGTLNTNCGWIQYTPQGVEYLPHMANTFPATGQGCHGEFTRCGPANGFIASGGHGGPIDTQTLDRWAKTTIKPGAHDFNWYYTQGHKTANWEYYITKKDWNPNQPLTRDSFEKTPLTIVPGGSVMPKPAPGTSATAGNVFYKGQPHKVVIPDDRSGYHIVLSTWKVSDNSNTFYQVVDLNIDNSDVTPSPWTDHSALEVRPLDKGAKVRARMFAKDGLEVFDKEVQLPINSTAQGHERAWPKALAEAVNTANLGYKIGVLQKDDEVVAQTENNRIYLSKGGNVSSVIISFEEAPKPGKLNVTGMKSEYELKNGNATLSFSTITEGGDFSIETKVFDAANNLIDQRETTTGKPLQNIDIQLKGVKGGEYRLVVLAKEKTRTPLQQEFKFTLKEAGQPDEDSNGDQGGGQSDGQYEHKFPQGLKSYKAGTLVLQPKDGKVYECKPFPYSGYCTQWNSAATQYEPGTGSHWNMAWIRK